MDLQIGGKVAVVTGGSRGIGLAVAKGLAAEGARVGVSARDPVDVEAAVAAIGASGGEAVAIPADVSDPGQIEMLFATVRDRLGEPQILINNAGGPPAGLPSELSEEQWAAGIELTLLSAVRLTRQALPAMRQARWGRIVNITSLAVKQPVLRLALSNSLRAAVTGYAKTLANEVAAEGITVNNVGPGYTATERLEELFEDEGARERLVSTIPARRFGTAEEVASLVVYLASQQAAYLTGQTIVPDGGATLGLL